MDEQAGIPGFTVSIRYTPGVAASAYNPSTWEAAVGGSEVQCHFKKIIDLLIHWCFSGTCVCVRVLHPLE